MFWNHGCRSNASWANIPLQIYSISSPPLFSLSGALALPVL
jgi:hypothetical protein